MTQPLAVDLERWSGMAGNDPVFVETGTYKCQTLQIARRIFRECHSVEISDELHSLACELMAEVSNVTLYHGDSAEVLPGLCSGIDGPCVFWLDAHSAAESVLQCVPPLMDEIASIGRRDNGDVIVIDDRQYFGQARAQNTDDWSTITDESIREALGVFGYRVVEESAARVCATR